MRSRPPGGAEGSEWVGGRGCVEQALHMLGAHPRRGVRVYLHLGDVVVGERSILHDRRLILERHVRRFVRIMHACMCDGWKLVHCLGPFPSCPPPRHTTALLHDVLSWAEVVTLHTVTVSHRLAVLAVLAGLAGVGGVVAPPRGPPPPWGGGAPPPPGGPPFPPPLSGAPRGPTLPATPT